MEGPVDQTHVNEGVALHWPCSRLMQKMSAEPYLLQMVEYTNKTDIPCPGVGWAWAGLKET